MSDYRLGSPVELPWWVIPLSLPPLLVVIAGIVLASPLWAHLLAVLTSVALILALTRIAGRVESRSMQSVWISVLYAVWVFIVVTWAVVVAIAPACHCS
ncbi:MAG: hypothetical protein JF887_05635 [Candidatus Dormibacteraeota bacterium]|uniref:Uncharacterized protein n=1 Tax=Candidatus Amunia macphersoniae TaxID=3127014 RepID=A0A934KHK0_9BACT|nr:hypothetical protein [Candidatus Dormibacteraeota bacterium]